MTTPNAAPSRAAAGVRIVKRFDEVRIGMSVYWVETWADRDGFGYRACGMEGWAAGDRREALRAARVALVALEAQHRLGGAA